MGIKQLYNDNLQKLPNEYRDVSVMQSQISYGASIGWGMKVCSNVPCHMTKMVAMPIYGKKPKNIFSGTKRPMALNLGMHHQVYSYLYG